MPHVTVPPRRHHRPRVAVTLFRAPPAPIAPPRPPRLSPLNAVSLQVIAGFFVPMPFIQLGHWLLGWPSVAVMWGGQ